MHQVVFLRLGLQLFWLEELLRLLSRLERILLYLHERIVISAPTLICIPQVFILVPLESRDVLNDAEDEFLVEVGDGCPAMHSPFERVLRGHVLMDVAIDRAIDVHVVSIV